jgi:hypothetical protein
LDFTAKLILKLAKTIPLSQEAFLVTLTELWLIFGNILNFEQTTVCYSILLSTECEYRLDTPYNLKS